MEQAPATLHAEAAGVASARHLELAANTFQQFRGTVVPPPAAGSASVTARFPEPALAARAAVEFQRRLVLFNLHLPEEQRASFHTAIHDNVDSAVNLARQGHVGRVLVSRAVSDSVVLERGISCTWLREDIFELLGGEAAGETGAETLEADTPAPAFIPTTRVAAELPARYEILSEIGRGGMGVVYKARDRETNDVVALKVLQAGLADDPGLLERFKNEMRLSRRITHKNVCRIHDFNRSGELAFISMEFIDGESVRDMLRHSGKLAIERSVELTRQVCAGLKEAHAQGVVHRDLKPENIMVDRNGVVKLMDFGIARSLDGATTHTRGIIGTPAYMAPEQAEGRPVDHRTDIYALGLVLFEMITGSQAFKGQTMVEVVLKQIREQPPRPRALEPTLPANLEEAILRCLKKDAERRFQTIEELDSVLSEKLVILPPPAEPVSPAIPLEEPQAPVPTPPPPISRRKRVWIVVLIFGSLFTLRQITKDRRSEPNRPVPVQKDQPAAAADTKDDDPEPAKDLDVDSALKELEKLKQTMPAVSEGLNSMKRFVPPRRIRAILNVADRQLEEGNYEEARNIYITALTLDPSNVRAKEGLDRVTVAMRDSVEKKAPKPPAKPPKPKSNPE